jgi:predicted nuclease of predicted toxin-antitoxin system
MRWLCNENIPRPLVDALRESGHDVVWIRDTSPGIADVEVLAIAVGDRRICLTFDKDFGELAAGASLPEKCGVVLLRLPPDWTGHFAVVEPGRVRMRRLTGK